MQKIDQPLTLFWIFFKIGLFTFGGGASMMPMLEKELSRFKYSQKEILYLSLFGLPLLFFRMTFKKNGKISCFL